MLKKLKVGDNIALIAPSGACSDFSYLERAKELFCSLGYNLVFYPTCYKKYLSFAGTDDERLEDIYSAFEDDTISAILCARGGYGTIKLLDKIDWERLKSNPKIFCGLSDITNLLLYFNSKLNIPTFHTSMPKRLINSDMIKDFISTVNLDKKNILPKIDSFIAINKMPAEGILWGGNLATLSTLIARDDFIPSEKIILFLEDLAEPVYKIDRMIQTILRNNKLKNNLSALILGDFLDVNISEIQYIFEELSFSLNIPVYFGYKISHSENNEAIPIGVKAVISENGNIRLI